MKIVGSQLLILVSIIFVIYVTGVESGETCRRKDVNGNEDIFSCPRLFESSKKKYCCGFTPQDKHCCELSQKYKDNPANVKYLFEGAVAIIILVLLIISGLIICCCVCACCLLSRKRQSRGMVLGNGNSRGESATNVTTVASHPNSVAYPVQPNAYPMQNVATPYPMDQPPPYSFNQAQPPYNPAYPIK